MFVIKDTKKHEGETLEKTYFSLLLLCILGEKFFPQKTVEQKMLCKMLSKKGRGIPRPFC
jgi:hypothetical protein